MNHRAAGPPPHAEVTNSTSYTLDNALGSCQAQPTLDGLHVVGPTCPGKDEVANSSSLLCSPGLLDQPYLSYGVTGYTLVPTQIGVVSTPIHTTNINHWGFCNEMAIFHRTTSGPTSLPDWCSNRQIRRYPDTPYAASSDIINAATGLAKVCGQRNIPNEPPPCRAQKETSY
ncbi:hypothetical protein EDC04DRAFT_1335944 [Pisolithus marmoratus]|nr:hypothetical protein EDC04DRAFT_1335944 [Pisolithus marmoratus]